MVSNIKHYVKEIKRLLNLNADTMDDNIIQFRKAFVRAGELVAANEIDEAIKFLDDSRELVNKYLKILRTVKSLLEYLDNERYKGKQRV